MKKLLLLTCAAVVALCANAYTTFYWRGPTDNPIWDTATANWSVSDSGAASTTYHHNNNDTIAKFDGQGAADVTVDAGGVSALVVEGRGSYAFYGGPISTTYLDPYLGNLTIYNTVNSGALRIISGQITVGDGGTLTVNSYYPMGSTADALDSAKVTVLSGGTLVVSNFDATVRSSYSTLYVNGGTIKYPQADWRNHSNFSTSKIKMGPGGMHFAQSWTGQQMFLPYPIENDGGDSEGLWLEDHSAELVLYGKPKVLADFLRPSGGCCNEGKCGGCKFLDKGNGYNVEDDCFADFDTDMYSIVTRAPQSWCYVEEISNGETK